MSGAELTSEGPSAGVADVESPASNLAGATAAPLIPVVMKDDAFQPPDCPTYYLLTGDGLFLERTTPLFTASVPVTGGVPGLQPHRPALTLRIPRLPSRLLAQAMGFFRGVYDQWRGEAILLMFYEPTTRRFVLRAPPQTITGRFEFGRFYADLHLDYRACERPGPEYVKVGTFHSHGNLGPAHSSIDLHDELYETGLHITAGYVNSSLPEFAAAFVVGRMRFTVRPDDVLPPFRTAQRPPPAWLQQVEVVCERWGRSTYAAPWPPPAAARSETIEATVRRSDGGNGAAPQEDDDGSHGPAD